MKFEQTPAPQERAAETVQDALKRMIETLNAIQAERASLDVDEIAFPVGTDNLRGEALSSLFAAAANEPATLLSLVDEIKDDDIRRSVIEEAVMFLGVGGDTPSFEEAWKKYETELRASGWAQEQVEGRLKVVRMDVIQNRINRLLGEGKVPEAMRMYLSNPEALEVSRTFDGFLWDFVESGGTFSQQIENYGRLPDCHQGMEDPDYVTRRLYGRVALKIPQGSPLSEQKAILQERFAAAPDILAKASIDPYRAGWTDGERLEFFKATRDKGDRESVLSRFLEYNFSPEGFQEVKHDLFEAYRKFKPEHILDRIEKFSEEFRALSIDERKALVDTWIEKNPVMLLYRTGNTLVLDEGQRSKLVDYFLADPHLTLGYSEFVSRAGCTEELIVRRAVETGMSARFLKMVTAGNLSDPARTALVNDVVLNAPAEFDAVIARFAKVDPEIARQGFDRLLARGDFNAAHLLASKTRVPLESRHLSESALRGIKLTDISRCVETYPEMGERLAMADRLEDLERLQGRAARTEYDSWKLALDPLLTRAYQDGVLSPEKAEDAELFLGFIKEFGAANTPRLLETYVGLKRAASLGEIPDPVRILLVGTLGRGRVEKMKSPAFLLNEVRKFSRGIAATLLQDEIPTGLASELGLELFESKKGVSNWEQDHDPRELIAKCEEFRRKHPEAAKVPEGYREARLKVALKERAPRAESPEMGDILQKPEVLKTADWYRSILDESWIGPRALRGKTAGERALPDEIRKLKASHASPEIRRVLGYAEQILFSGMTGTDLAAECLEELAAFEDTTFDRVLGALSAFHMIDIMPEGFVDDIDAFGSSAWSVSALRHLRRLLVDYVSEHYLHRAQETHRTGHAPFSPKLRTALERVWGTADIGNNPLVKAFNDTEALIKKHTKLSMKIKDIALVPVQGLLRAYSGDLADACYTSRHQELAEGKYPDLHAMIFVTGRGTAGERFAGSVLFVETETPPEAGGKKVLMVRANNPRENLIQEVNADALITQTLDEAITIAKRRGLDMVVVPLDEASASSSNRPDVADFYRDHFANNDMTALVREAETNFNGYPNWNPESGHGVAVIWRREAEESGEKT